MIQNCCKLICLATFSLMSVVAVAQQSDLVKGIKDDINREKTEKRGTEALAQNHVVVGNKAFTENKYKEAVDSYLEAITIYKSIGAGEENPVFKEKINRCREQISKSYFNWAEKMVFDAEKEASSNKFEEAIKLCREAILIYPDAKKRIEDRIAKYEELRKGVDHKLEVEENRLMPTKEETAYNIKVMLRQAKTLYNKKQYEDARRKFEDILVIDPFQIEATQGLRAVNIRIQEIAYERLNKSTIPKAVVEAEWKYGIGIKPETIKDGDNVTIEAVSKELPDNKIQTKLKSIVIPRIDFEDVTIPTAIKYLREQSKQLDPEGEGINIFLRLAQADPQAAGAQPAAPAAPKPAEGEDDEAAPTTRTSTNETTLNFVLSNKTLQEALYYLCRAANLRMRVEKYAVVVASHNIPLDDLETRIFPLEQAALASIGGGSDPELLKKYFMERGIRFPEGAKVVFDPKISRLIATNTLENLREIENRVLNELNHIDPMVQIQAKFVEIEQNDLKELGFSYSISRTLDAGESPYGKLEFSQNDNIMRSVPNVGGSDQLFTYARSFNGYDFSMTVKALDQADNKSILASPRITTMNMREATINMVREVYLPEDYSDPKEETHNASNDASTSYSVFVAGSPDFAEYMLGISMPVFPNVDIEQRTITLRMRPTIKDLVNWTVYTYKASADDTLETVMKRPVLSERKIDTNVTIYDGETIVLGGIIKDSFDTIDDKVPILGDIPIVGRFFQSKYTKSAKVNLLIFLHCRLVKPDGSPFFTDGPKRGLPEFPKER